MTDQKQLVWEGGDINRPLQLQRPCPCGCDEREGYKSVGYLTGGDGKTGGFTLWIEDEKVYTMLDKILNKS